MLVGNTKSCEAFWQDVCKFASTRQAVLSKLEESLSDLNFTEMPFVVSLSCNSFSNSMREKRGM